MVSRLLLFPPRRASSGCLQLEITYALIQLQLIASSFILNYTNEVDEFTIYPFLNSFSNIRTKAELLTAYTIPDVLPSSLSTSAGGDMSFASGDFLIIYSSPSSKGSWDVITTCFFIDTARNSKHPCNALSFQRTRRLIFVFFPCSNRLSRENLVVIKGRWNLD